MIRLAIQINVGVYFLFFQGNASVNASNNWWGDVDGNIAYGRVYDFHQDSSLLMVNITPVLTERRIDCSDVNNCSSNGECVSPNRCRCFSGKYKFCDVIYTSVSDLGVTILKNKLFSGNQSY
jgi:hypothetical protein